MQTVDENGEFISNKPQNWNWYFTYVINPQPGCAKFTNKFHRHFRLPYHAFLNLLNEMKKHKEFATWLGGRADAVN